MARDPFTPYVDPYWLTREECAELLGVSLHTIVKWCAKGWLQPRGRRGNALVYHPDEVRAAALYARHRRAHYVKRGRA